jgi:hypothetical protein
MEKNNAAPKLGADGKPVPSSLTVVKTDKQAPTTPKVANIEDLKARASLMTILSQKHEELTTKRRELERFAISHDKNNAQMSVVDATGKEFSSSNPKSIGQLLTIWKAEFEEAIKATEEELRAVAFA